MPTTDLPLSEDDAVLAGELALGVLEGEDLASARRRLIAEPAFAREVERWRDHFAAAALRGPDVAPPAGVEHRIAAALASEAGTRVAPLAPERPENRATPRPGTWRAGLGGMGLGLGLGAAAAALAFVLLRPAAMPPAPPALAAPVLVAALDVPSVKGTVLARIDAGHLRLTGALAVPERRDAQAWLIDKTGVPRSLGVLRRVDGSRLETVPTRAVAPGQTLAISIEPLGGAPGALPTGTVVATGTIQTI